MPVWPKWQRWVHGRAVPLLVLAAVAEVVAVEEAAVSYVEVDALYSFFPLLLCSPNVEQLPSIAILFQLEVSLSSSLRSLVPWNWFWWPNCGDSIPPALAALESVASLKHFA